MPRLSTEDQRQVGELVRRLRTLEDGGEPGICMLVEPLARMCGADRALAYGVESGVFGAGLRFAYSWGMGQGFAGTFGRWLNGRADGWAHYRAQAPDPRQRNRALTLSDLSALTATQTSTVQTEFCRYTPASRDDQLRTLICDGPRLLAWIGCFREGSFGVREKQILASLIPALTRRLVLEEKLAGYDLRSAALLTALEAIPSAALLVDKAGRVVAANASGRALRDSDPQGMKERLMAARGEGAVATSEVQLHRIETAGAPEHHLALMQMPRDTLKARLAACRERWKISARQAQVLEQLVGGASNKELSTALGCAVNTVENHVSALLHRAGCSSRAELVARFWKEA